MKYLKEDRFSFLEELVNYVWISNLVFSRLFFTLF